MAAEAPKKHKLSARAVEAFAATYLESGFDDPKPTPDFHRQVWELYCSDAEKCLAIAPRGHAKSSAFTHTYGLAAVCLRLESYVILVSTNEELAIEHLGDMTRELSENEDLIKDFKISKFVTLSKTEIVVEFTDGEQFRILARGSGQKIRGRKWRGRRPGLILCDDLEDDEQCESRDRREKFRRWFYRAVLPSLRRGGLIRVHGTILHPDSLLARLRKNRAWQSLFFRAHKSFDDFSELLWPQQFTPAMLREIRRTYVEDGDAPGYSQEYLNQPLDNSEAYLKREWFLGMEPSDYDLQMRKSVGCDFAVSKNEKADRTSFTVGGVPADNRLLVVDQRVGRWDLYEAIELLFELQLQHDPDVFYVEDGVIWKAMSVILMREMRIRGIYLNCYPIPSLKDKAVRGRNLQKRMRAGAVAFDKEADWYAQYEDELLTFTGYSEAVRDDQFDSTALLAKGLDIAPMVDNMDFATEDELDYLAQKQQHTQVSMGRSDITGY